MLIETFYWAMNSLTGSQDRAGDRYMLNERFYWTMVSQTGSQDRARDRYNGTCSSRHFIGLWIANRITGQSRRHAVLC